MISACDVVRHPYSAFIGCDTPFIKREVVMLVHEQLAATIFSTPVMQREQVYGYLLDEGIISTLEQVENVDLGEGRVRVRLSFDPSSKLTAASTYRVVTTACGLWNPEFARLLDRVNQPYVRSLYSVKAGEAFRMLDDFNRRPEIWKATGATHSAALY
jgi:formate dehydrogenase accessory protein FdhD